MDSLFRISMLQKHVLRRWVRNTVHAWRLGCEGSEMPLAAEDPMLALWLWGAQHPSSESKGGAQARQQVWTASSPPMFTSVAMAGKWVSVWMWGPRHCFRFSSSQSPGPRGPATSKTRGGGGGIYAHQPTGGGSWLETARRGFMSAMVQEEESLNGWASFFSSSEK